MGGRSNQEELPCDGDVRHPLPSHCLWGHFRGPTCRNHLQPAGSSYCLSLFGPWAIPPCTILFTFHWCLKKRKAIWPLSLSTFRKELILPKFRQHIIRISFSTIQSAPHDSNLVAKMSLLPFLLRKQPFRYFLITLFDFLRVRVPCPGLEFNIVRCIKYHY